MFFISPMYLLFTIPALLLSFYAQYKVKSTFNKYAKVHSGRGMTGAQAARRILDANGLQHVGVEAVNGFLSDHYDPRSKVLRLSPDVYNTPSLSAVGVAAHEAGHALQDQQNYALFSLVTLPVEFDASKRAKQLLVTEGVVTNEEVRGVDKVLDAAALTYVAAALQAIMTLAYYAFILLGRRE